MPPLRKSPATVDPRTQPARRPTTVTPDTPQIPLPNVASKQAKKERKQAWLRLGKAGLWLALWLGLIDLGINLFFPYPTDVRKANPLSQYFEYGRSIEGKLNRMIKDTVEDSAPIVEAGWIEPNRWRKLHQTPLAGDDLLVASYGMSFSEDVAIALTEIDNQMTQRIVVGPSAPANHTFASFIADTEGQNADVAVFGVLASSVKRMGSLSGTSWTPENPAPYTYPYYSLDNEQNLVAVVPSIQTADEFIEAFNQRNEQWQQLKQQMKQYDQSFDPLVFYHNISDRSAIVRLIRRGWAHRAKQLAKTALYDPEQGFNPDASEIQTLNVLLSEFARIAKAADQQPIVLLINDQGYGDHLYQVLSPQLDELDIDVLSTHSIASADDPSHFLEDSHFTAEVNREIATVLQQMIRNPQSSLPLEKN
ncbi:MAG: hypothetical protein AAFQ63_04405 [Cyanobacteria bacterium J06621_11]